MVALSTASWIDGEPENQKCVAAGALGALDPGPYLGLTCLLQPEGEGWERCLKPDLPLAQQLFIQISAGLGKKATVA